MHSYRHSQSKQPAIAPTSASTSNRLWVLGLLLIGFALRLYHLGGESLWYDETVSAYLANLPITDLIAHTERDIHPPAYYLLLHLWQLITQPSVAFGLEYLYAWPSFCLSILVMGLTYAIAKRCFGPTAARWALALALLQPTQVWFAQEVRMYALGAFCLLLTLWAITPLLLDLAQHPRTATLPTSSLVLYAIAALMGLYTLYYFLFWLAILNLCIIVRLWKNGHALRNWIVVQIIVLIGWLPWLPIFIRQAITPPVPGWRVPWQSVAEVAQALSEGIAAIWVGHTPPLAATWPWAILVFVTAVAFVGYAKMHSLQNRFLWLSLTFGPLLLLFIVSLVGPPIYHVRYVATYAPLFVLLLASLLANPRRLPALILFVPVALISALSLQQLWTNPLYAADDHRAAVATLAHQWRPGDAILVNAGWVYTGLSVYWPTELSSPNVSRPPAITDIVRLTDLDTTQAQSAVNGPLIIRTGSVDGESTLGWGLPESDFFPIAGQAITATMTQLATAHPHIWHYRLYDTVSDPSGLIRAWLSANTELTYSQAMPGRDFLLLEGYRTNAAPMPADLSGGRIDFPDAALSLLGHTYSPQHPAGETLYVNLAWHFTATTNVPTALSLRLYDAQGQFLLQSDYPLTVTPMGASTQSLALSVPADTIPGNYTLSLVIYSPETLAPYTATAIDGSPIASPLTIGEIAIVLPTTLPQTATPLATFDYIDLLQVAIPTTPVVQGAMLNTSWTWRPQASNYRDQYIAHLELTNAQGQQIPLAAFNLGGDSYLSSVWPAGYPLTQHVATALTTLPPGSYQLHLSLTRASDNQKIGAHLPWWPFQQPSKNVGALQIIAGE